MIALAASLIASCASQNSLASEYKKKTVHINRENPSEVILAQHLYNEMKPLKSND